MMKTHLAPHVLSDLLMGSSIDALIAIGIDDEIFAWNKAANTFYKAPNYNMIGKALADVLPSIKEDGDFLSALQQAKDGNESFLPPSEQYAHRQNLETHFVPLKIEGEPHLHGVMILAHDVSHRIAKEQEFRKLNNELEVRLRQLRLTSRELTHLTHIATHNIKEPIKTVYTAVEFLIQTEAKNMSNSGRASFRRVQSALNRMRLIIDDLIALTQINILDSPTIQVNLKNLAAEVSNQFRQRLVENNVELTFGELTDIRAHRDQLLLLLQHVLSNVIKFNDSSNPYINISCKKTRVPEEKMQSGQPGEYAVLSIKHNGHGFTNVDVESIFKKLEVPNEEHYTSSAIASVILAKVMEAHGGWFTIEFINPSDTEIRCMFPV